METPWTVAALLGETDPQWVERALGAAHVGHRALTGFGQLTAATYPVLEALPTEVTESPLTSLIWRSCGNSSCETVAHFHLVGRTEGSSRKTWPRWSSAANISSTESRFAAYCCIAASSVMMVAGGSCSRFQNHESFGMIHVMESGATPRFMRKSAASMPVFPAPTTT